MNRRDFLTTGAACLTGLTANAASALAAPLPARLQPASEPVPIPQPAAGNRNKPLFSHRAYLGWITDLATQPDTNADWPSLRLDAPLMKDYRRAFALLKQLQFQAVSVWGLYVARAWPVEIEKAVSPARGAQVERLIALAHAQGLRVYSGLGVYSWGFEEIIRANPQVSRGNPRALCASEPQAWEWMRKVIDFVFARFPIDGVSLQSADQGRCPCADCRVYTDAEYHALLNERAGHYIRSRWPGKTIGVNSWGMRFDDPANLPSLVKIGQNADYLIDVNDTSRRADPGYRKKVVAALACDFGTLGGPQTEPPQHWARDRWFLPTLRRTGEHLHDLYADGGRACEYFFHIAANPGDELSLWLAGRTLAQPETPWQAHLQSSVAALYGTKTTATRDALAALFLRAEDAYFRHQPPHLCGTVSLEPLESNHPGEPIYLTQRLNADQRKEYAADLQALKTEAEKLLPDVPAAGKMRAIVCCLDNALQDLRQVAAR